MNGPRQRILEAAGDCSGATVIEYAVLLCLIVLVSVSMIYAIGADWTTVVLAYLSERLHV